MCCPWGTVGAISKISSRSMHPTRTKGTQSEREERGVTKLHVCSVGVFPRRYEERVTKLHVCNVGVSARGMPEW